MTTTDHSSDLQAVVDAGIAIAQPRRLDDRFYSVTTPAGAQHHVIDLEQHRDRYRDRPRRKTGTTVVHDADSFVTYLAKHALPETEIYADVTTGALVAVINAHGHVEQTNGVTAVEADDFAGWGDHRLHLQLHKTTAWKAWEAHDRRLLGQVDFAEHIEDRLLDIVTPPGADMLELAQTFQATRAVGFESSKRLSSGQTQLTYREEENATAGKKGQLQIPERFELALVPFEGGEPYKVTARLRYRINGATLAIGYVLDRPEDILRAAFLDTVTDVASRTQRDVLNGVPNR